MKKIITGFVVATLIFIGVAAPQPVLATSYYYDGQTMSSAQLRVLLIAQIQALLAQLDRLDDDYYRPTNSTSRVDVETLSARSIEDDRAQLMGEVDLNNEDKAYVWFEYGTSRSLKQKTGEATIKDNDPERFVYSLRNLSEYRTYYYRAMAEDENGRVATGAIRSFRTDGDDDWDDDRDFDDDEPEVETDDAENVRRTSAELHGSVEMNDYEDGLAFFAYGEDEDAVADIESEYDEFDDIDEDGLDLQVVEMEDGLDEGDDERYELFVTGLDDDTEYFFAMCLQFEDDYGDETIVCGSVEDFETDR